VAAKNKNIVGNLAHDTRAYKENMDLFGSKQKQVHFRIDGKLHKEAKQILENHGLSISDFGQFVYSKLGMHDRIMLELVAEFQMEKMEALTRNKNVSEVRNNKSQAELIFQLIAQDNETT